MELTMVRTVSGREASLTLTTRLGLTDYQRAQQAAEQSGLALGTWVRTLILAALEERPHEVQNGSKK